MKKLFLFLVFPFFLLAYEIDLKSNEYTKESKQYSGILIETHFFKKDAHLSQKYLTKTVEYIKYYEKLIGKFPYKTLKIIESKYPVGHAMPQKIIIGQQIIDKEYIFDRSLAHEIVHQYFGCAVENDHNKGNWIEGLTAYLSDWEFSKDKKQFRKNILNSFEVFVNNKNEIPIRAFKYRHDKPSQLIGYGKLGFVFHMIKNKIGKDNFNLLIKKLYNEYKFKELNLYELSDFVVTNSTITASFLKQWLYKKGKIEFEIENLIRSYDKNGFWISFDITQKEENFNKFDLPIEIETYETIQNKNISIVKSKQTIKLNFKSEPLNITFDKNYNLFRKLYENEQMLSIGRLLTDSSIILVLDKKFENRYKNTISMFAGAKIRYSDELKFKELKENSVIFLDANNELLNYFYPGMKIDLNSTAIIVKPHIYNDKKQIAVLHIGNKKTAGKLKMLKHYTIYKNVVFNEKQILKEIEQTQNGLIFKLSEVASLYTVKQSQTLKNIINEIGNEKIIYVGESHNNLNHHLNQLRVVKALHKKGLKVAIGMEMFQQQFQKEIDDYIAGKTDLNGFLKQTQYFKRWKFDYNLYKPIIDYAKQNQLPIIALNIDRNITKKVSKNGLLYLSQKERKLLPKQIDQSNLEYKSRLSTIFTQHYKDGNKTKLHQPSTVSDQLNTDFYYQSQLIWDEIMAQNIDDFIQKNPVYVIVVIAGSGHIQGHSGIPSRVYRRNGLPYKVILNDTYSRKTGDIVLRNSVFINPIKQPKLGVYLKNDQNLTVVDIVPNSFAKSIGIKKGDKILKFGNEEVKDLYDLKRVLYLTEELNSSLIVVQRGAKTIKLTSHSRNIKNR